MNKLSQFVSSYLEMCEYEKKLSPDTVKAYRIDLTQFLDFSEGGEVDVNTIDRYIRYLNQSFAPRTVKRKLASLRAFFHELELSGRIPESPFEKLHIRIHTPQQLPRVIPDDIVKRLLQSAYDAYAPKRAAALRDILVLELLFSTGVRVSELCELSADTFQLHGDRLSLLI